MNSRNKNDVCHLLCWTWWFFRLLPRFPPSFQPCCPWETNQATLLLTILRWVETWSSQRPTEAPVPFPRPSDITHRPPCYSDQARDVLCSCLRAFAWALISVMLFLQITDLVPQMHPSLLKLHLLSDAFPRYLFWNSTSLQYSLIPSP